MLAIQYLEPGPHIEGIRPQAAAGRLQEACRRLPLTDLILGWDLPQPLLEACASQAQKNGLRLWLWHPLLSAQGLARLLPGCQVLGLAGTPLGGASPEFTFLCPNQAQVYAGVLERLDRALDTGAYQGVFLDRIRWPSAAAGAASLGCFCPACRERAAAAGLDLDAAGACWPSRTGCARPCACCWSRAGAACRAMRLH